MSIQCSKAVYIVDDDPLLRRSVHLWLTERQFEPRSFSGPFDFIEELPNLRPGCALIDVCMPQLDGLDLLREHEAALRHFAVIMMTGHGDVAMAVDAMKGGAVDFIEKPFALDTLVNALVVAEERLASRLTTTKKCENAASLINTLTTREADTLRGLLAGLSNKSLAHNLNLSPRTVEMHRSNVMKKLGTRSLSEALKIAIDAGIPAGNYPQSAE